MSGISAASGFIPYRNPAWSRLLQSASVRRMLIKFQNMPGIIGTHAIPRVYFFNTFALKGDAHLIIEVSKSLQARIAVGRQGCSGTRFPEGSLRK